MHEIEKAETNTSNEKACNDLWEKPKLNKENIPVGQNRTNSRD